ncbi:MAG: hypothetical protein AAFX80_21305 [Cyanobacteria bacterium J06639_18]
MIKSLRLRLQQYKALDYFLFLSVFSTIWTFNPVSADTAHFGKLTLSPDFKSVGKMKVTGHTGGSYSLSAISNRDRDRNLCIGFADTKPDHILVLEKDFSRLSLQVDSGGYDTTLLLQGPGKKEVFCGDDTGDSKDASVEVSNLKSGEYKLWIGTFKSGMRREYSISIEQELETKQ